MKTMRTKSFLAIMALATALTINAQSDSVKFTSDFGVLGQVEGLYSDGGGVCLNIMPGGNFRVDYGDWFAGGRLNIYTGNDTDDGSYGFFLSQLKFFAGRKIGNGELKFNLGKIRRQELQTSPWTMTGTAIGQNTSLAFGVLATAPKTAMIEYKVEKFGIFAGYYEDEREFLLKFFGGGTAFVGGDINLLEDKIYFSGGLDVQSGNYFAFGSVRAKVGGTAVMLEGSRIGVRGEENFILNVNQKVGKFTLAAEGHFKENYTRGLVTVHSPQGLWVGAGYQDIGGQKSGLLSVGITVYFSLIK